MILSAGTGMISFIGCSKTSKDQLAGNTPCDNHQRKIFDGCAAYPAGLLLLLPR